MTGAAALSGCGGASTVAETPSPGPATGASSASAAPPVSAAPSASPGPVGVVTPEASATSADSTPAAAATTAATAPWTPAKADALRQFMATWGAQMGQAYKEYGPGNNVDLYGLQVPDQVLDPSDWDFAVDYRTAAIAWSDDGRGDGYRLVAVYSDAETQPYLEQHVYFFVLLDGQPQVLYTMQNQGISCEDASRLCLTFSPSANADLQAGFAAIVTQGS
ncbi:MAG: DUF4767 domain-containing protein [Propionibacteriaceae bacterium]|nr:DUF4767 domain-containing protein [Propionibacteriaceae bacterium]